MDNGFDGTATKDERINALFAAWVEATGDLTAEILNALPEGARRAVAAHLEDGSGELTRISQVSEPFDAVCL